MRILYDQQIFSFQNYGGISRYFYELITRISKLKDVKALVDGKFSNNIYLSRLKEDVKEILPGINFPFKNVFMFYLNNFLDNKNLREGKFDILHATYYHPYFMNKLKGKPYVLTVHDLTHELFTNDVGGFQSRTIRYKKKTIISANHIITVSKNTKKDLMRIYDIPSSKITVIYHGNPFDRVIPKEFCDLPNRYLLFVGNRQGYKNFLFFIRSISPLLRKYKDLYLICAGGGSFSHKENQLMFELKIHKQVKQIGFKNDSELAYIYKKALVYVLPSLYEGFGLTLLEAFSMGCPVVASNTSSIPEVCGDAALFVNPKDSESIVGGIERVIYNPDLRNKLIKLGKNRVTKFSWNRTAKETLRIYHEVVDSRI